MAACGADNPDPLEPIDEEEAALTQPASLENLPKCESIRDEVVPFSTTSCMGPWATCQAVTVGWAQRTITNQVATQTYTAATASAANAQCSSFSAQFGTTRVDAVLISEITQHD